MNTQYRWKSLIAGGAALMLTLGAVTLYPQVSQAQTATPNATEQAEVSTTPGTPEQRGRGGRMDVDRDALLAEALGISTEELQAAYTEAAQAALDQAVADGQLTQDQADRLAERLAGADAKGFGRFGFGHFGGGDFQALLAEALGITPEALQEAEVTARNAAIDQAVEDGNLTQEQADLAKAVSAFRAYVAEQQPTVEEQLAQAVEAGAITQEQADLLLENQPNLGGMRGHGLMGPDMGGRGMHGGRGMRGGHGMDGGRGMRGMPFDNQDQPQDDAGESQGNSNLNVPAANF
jgi:polyhydroxyalkanoate synthesis regulator phasin